MCGIAGIVCRDGTPDLKALSAMRAQLSHRGPDDSGQHVDGPVALAHTRLSIIDLAGGHQPLFGRNKRHYLIANGEIYNFLEIRQRLKAEGYSFQTHSDCEVILPLYARHGADCVLELRGMFAFALWDAERRKLLLGRDRMGEKPLYYAFDGQQMIFASELRALLASGLVSKQLDPKEVSRFFRYQYVPEPRTPFVGIDKVPAGAILELDLEAWEIREVRYWSAWDAAPVEGDPKVLIRETLEDAVQSALISDVPIGLSLSGGVDSSILACLMRANTTKDIHAISVGYPDASHVDERPQAKALAGRLGLVFHDVELSDENMVRTFPSIAAGRDDPIGDISGYSYHAVMRHARDNGVKVMMQGHGADELCWGYPWVKDAVAINEGRLLDGLASSRKGRSTRERLGTLARHWKGLRAQKADGFQMFDLQPFTAWAMKNGTGLFTPEFQEASGWRNISSATEYGQSGLRTDLEVTRLIVEFYLQENGIAQGDRLSMANSVEVRLPFVDHKLVETIIGLRKVRRDDHLPPKYWLKESVRDLLDDEVLDRPKRGFSPPGVRWQKLLRETYGELLRDGFLTGEGILSETYANALSRPEISAASEAIASRLAITFELWARGVILGERIGASPFETASTVSSLPAGKKAVGARVVEGQL